MSKRNMLLGLAAGKVGDLVFYRDGGEQRTRTRVIPKNPRSPRQMAQRVKLANVVNTFRQLQSIITDSFPNRPSNQSGYNAFAKGGIAISPYMQKEAASRGLAIPCPYMISRGSIDSLPFQIREEDMLKGLTLPIPGLRADTANVGSVSAALLSAYPFLSNGDELIFIMVGFPTVSLTDGTESFAPGTEMSSFVIDTASKSNFNVAGLAAEDDGLFMSATIDTIRFQGAVLASRVDGSGQLQVSTATFDLSDEALVAYDESLSEQARLRCIDSYGVGEQSILRD